MWPPTNLLFIILLGFALLLAFGIAGVISGTLPDILADVGEAARARSTFSRSLPGAVRPIPRRTRAARRLPLGGPPLARSMNSATGAAHHLDAVRGRPMPDVRRARLRFKKLTREFAAAAG